jgi:DNA-binding transcriptional MerR regulator
MAKMSTCHPDRIHRARGLCNSCYTALNKKKNPGVQNRYSQKNRKRLSLQKRLRSYGLTLSGLRQLEAEQQGLCAICREKPCTHVDHNHATNEIRGILCRECNTLLGQARESEGILLLAVEYLRIKGANPTAPKELISQPCLADSSQLTLYLQIS